MRRVGEVVTRCVVASCSIAVARFVACGGSGSSDFGANTGGSNSGDRLDPGGRLGRHRLR